MLRVALIKSNKVLYSADSVRTSILGHSNKCSYAEAVLQIATTFGRAVKYSRPVQRLGKYG